MTARGAAARSMRAREQAALADLQTVSRRANDALAVARELYEAGDGASVLVLHAAALLAIAEQLAVSNALAIIAEARSTGELPTATLRAESKYFK